MRVKISKTCELEEVPELVVQMLLQAREQLTELSKRKYDYWSPGELAKQVSDLRFNLADLDFRLEDAQSIIVGYVETINNSAESVPITEHVAEEVTDDE